MIQNDREKSSIGFSLLEILVALFIFAIITTTVFGSFRFVFSNAGTLNEDLTTSEMLKNCLDRMVYDFQSIHVSLPPEYTLPSINAPLEPYHISGEIVSETNAELPRLRFTALAHLPLEKRLQNGIAEITYYTQISENKDFVLKRSDKLYPYDPFTEKGSDPILCENLKSLKFAYYDHAGNTHEHWNSDSEDFGFATPRAIGIKLEAGNTQQTVVIETIVNLPAFRNKSDKEL